jgi:hypothetical protein
MYHSLFAKRPTTVRQKGQGRYIPGTVMVMCRSHLCHSKGAKNVKHHLRHPYIPLDAVGLFHRYLLAVPKRFHIIVVHFCMAEFFVQQRRAFKLKNRLL